MQNYLRSGSFRLALITAACTVTWAACSQKTAYPEGTESAGDAATSGSAGVGGSGGTKSSATTGTGSGTGGGTSSPAPIEARFVLPDTGAPAFLAVPFPSDLYLGANGLIADVPGLSAYVPVGSAALVAGLAPLDGFGRTAGAIFAIDDLSGKTPVPAAIDLASLPATEADSMGATATAMLIDLDATSAATALVPARADYHDDAALGTKTKPLLTVFPGRGIVLAPKHLHVAILTTGVKTKDMKSLAASPAFAAVRDGKMRTTVAQKMYGAAIDKASSLVPSLKDKTKIAAIAVFTTNDTAHELFDLRAELTKLAPPVLKWDIAAMAPMGAAAFANAPLPAGFTATLDAWLGVPAKLGDTTDDPANDQLTGRAHDQIAAIGTAVFDAPNLLVEAMKGYSDPIHHTFARDASGKPIINAAKPTSKIWMTIALPKSKPPASGYPTVILQHGLGDDRSFLLALADTFAKKGWASVAIETVTFGARAAEAGNTIDVSTTFPWNKSAGAYNGPDGFVDVPNGSTDFFGVLENLGAVRDQMRQSVLDIGAAIDVVRNPAIDFGPLALAVPGAKFDASKVVYLGNSLGGVMGAILAAVDPHVNAFVLNVAGGGLIPELGSYSPNIASSLKLAAGFNFGFAKNRFPPGHPLVQLLQHIVDAGDSLDYAASIVNQPATVNGTKNPRKSVLQIEVLFDETVSNQANEALARAAGFPLAQPSVGPVAGVPLGTATPMMGVISGTPFAGITAVLVQAGPATHSANLLSKTGTQSFAHPFPQFDQKEPFPPLVPPVTVNEPYLALQGMVTEFFASAFAGAGAPIVKGFPTPMLQ